MNSEGKDLRQVDPLHARFQCCYCENPRLEGTPYLHLLTLQPCCINCADTNYSLKVVSKSRAKRIFSLSDARLDSLPSVLVYSSVEYGSFTVKPTRLFLLESVTDGIRSRALAKDTSLDMTRYAQCIEEANHAYSSYNKLVCANMSTASPERAGFLAWGPPDQMFPGG